MHNHNLVEALLHLCLLQRVAVQLHLLLHPRLLLVEATEVEEDLLRLLQPIGVLLLRHLLLLLYNSNSNSKILLLIPLRWVLVL
jgi:hypothetical protein